MQHAVLVGVEKIALEQREVSSPGAGQVRVRIHSVGICGSDLHYFKDGRIKGLDIPMPCPDGFKGVMGHECSGVVEAVGAGVVNIKVWCCYNAPAAPLKSLFIFKALLVAPAGGTAGRLGARHALLKLPHVQRGAL